MNYYAIPGINRRNLKGLSVKILKDATADFFGISVSMLESKRNLSELVKARYFMYHYGYKVKGFSLSELGRATYKKDHSCVWYGVRSVDNLCSVDKEYKKQMNDYIVYMDSQKN